VKYFRLLLLLGLAMGVNHAVLAAASDDDWFRGRLFTPEVVLRHAGTLKLTEAQRKIVRQEIIKVQKAVAGIDVEMMEEGLALQDAIDRLPVDRTIVLDHADKVFAADTLKKRAWIEMLINIKNSLTAAQVEALRAIEGSESKP
jgi:hypothetical protein